MPILHLTLEMLLFLHISFFHSMPINIASLGNDDCVAMGWGKKKSDADEYEVSMKQIKLPMVPNDQCQKALRDKTYLFSRWKLHSSFVCAGGIEGEDACDGDGGGPLVCRAKDDPDR